LNPLLEDATFAVFLSAVVVVAWFGGIGPCVLAQTLTLAAALLLTDPQPPNREPAVKVWAGLAAFFFVGIVAGVLSDSMRAARRRAQQEADEAISQREQLREADRRKDEFLATLAHELRNPLAPIRTGLELMKLCADKPETVAQVRVTMERQVQQMVRLIDDLLDVSRITRGKLQLRRCPVELADIVHTAVDATRPFIDGARHELTLVLPDEPVVLDADASRLAQVLANLLNNAAKYTPAGGRITLSAEQRDREVAVTIRDTGMGIPPGMCEQIFGLFVQVGRSMDGGDTGLGIGLTLVKSLVELHGGRVDVQSAGLNQGSAFTVRLPVVSRQVPQTSPPDRRLVCPGAVLKRRVLIADDNLAALETLSLMIELLGYEVRRARDGAEAVALAETFRPDTVLMDLGMPNVNGYEAARRMREQPWGRRLLLIATTGWGQEEDRRRSREAGFDHHLVKPIDTEVLRDLLDLSERDLPPSRNRLPSAANVVSA
jgi:signal transduction histidine kinase/ActR/RegA family two-component response regulator